MLKEYMRMMILMMLLIESLLIAGEKEQEKDLRMD